MPKAFTCFIAAIICLIVFGMISSPGYSDNVCQDSKGTENPCDESSALTSYVPVKTSHLSDSNTVETVKRFYQAMTQHDTTAASRLLADSFTSEVHQGHKPAHSTRDDKTSMMKGLEMVLGATQLYNAKIACQVLKRTPQAFSLSCLVDEQGIVMDQFRRTLSDQAVTVVLDEGVAKIAKIISVQHN